MENTQQQRESSETASAEKQDDYSVVFRRESHAGGGRKAAANEDHQFALKPLVEMGVVGACRRGRRRGRRNRTAVERESEVEERRQSKNARERERVENVRNEYAKLQKLLGLDLGELDDDDCDGGKDSRRFCKLRILTAAIERIKTLMELLRTTNAPPTALPLPLTSDHGDDHASTIVGHQTAKACLSVLPYDTSPDGREDGAQLLGVARHTYEHNFSSASSSDSDRVFHPQFSFASIPPTAAFYATSPFIPDISASLHLNDYPPHPLYQPHSYPFSSYPHHLHLPPPAPPVTPHPLPYFNPALYPTPVDMSNHVCLPLPHTPQLLEAFGHV